jgi:hypothetical protein
MRFAGRTGAGDSDDEVESEIDMTSVEERIALEQGSDIRHDAIEVPLGESLFDEETERLFLNALTEIQRRNPTPSGYGVAQEEWPEDGYPSNETIKVGRGKKSVMVELPVEVWWPRAVRWAQALDLLNRVLVEVGR